MRKWFTIVLLFLIPFSASAKVIETQHIEDIIPFIDDETWVLVDLDNCMFEGAQAFGHANWFYDLLQQKIAAGISREEAIREIYPTWIEAQEICRVKPLDSQFVPILVQLQNKGLVIMGLTHRQLSVAESTSRQVASLGFNFLETAPTQESFKIPANQPALYVNGILFVGDYNKKIDIFKLFLEKINKHPTKIVFIDDKRKNVDELEVLTKEGIVYTGIHYTAIDHVKPTYIREVAECQSKYFNQILSNEAAQLLIQHELD
ncbi:MAG: DUF2608 domain-containing protein [Parachlamydiaceae bacterium]|nr:DUF2608 domain-containing protein [Parachlamydiaceae bacterium]